MMTLSDLCKYLTTSHFTKHRRLGVGPGVHFHHSVQIARSHARSALPNRRIELLEFFLDGRDNPSSVDYGEVRRLPGNRECRLPIHQGGLLVADGQGIERLVQRSTMFFILQSSRSFRPSM